MLNTYPCCPHLLSCLIPNTVMSSTPVIKGTEVTVTLGLEDTMIQKHSSGSKQSPGQAGLVELEVCRMGYNTVLGIGSQAALQSAFVEFSAQEFMVNS